MAFLPYIPFRVPDKPIYPCKQGGFVGIEQKAQIHDPVNAVYDRDYPSMIDDDLPDAARLATAASVLQCLTMLAEEAENLNLPRTLLSLRKAIRACHAEQARLTPLWRPRRHLVLH